MNCPSIKISRAKLTIALAFVLFVFTAVTLGQPVLAQIDQAASEQPSSKTTLTAIPPRLGDDDSLSAKPGEVIQATVKVRNSSAQPLNVLSSTTDFILSEDGSTPIPVADPEVSNRWSLASWITLAPNLQTIGPNETKIISVVIAVPDDALPGGHYAMITHQPTTANAGSDVVVDDTTLSASGISQKVGTLLYVKVEGPINESAFIRSFTFPKLTEYGPAPYSFSIENQSDIHIQPAVMMEIHDMFGRKVDQFPIESKNIFPLTERKFDGSWDKIWGTGRYTATITMSYGSQGAIAIAKASFWMFPVTLVVAAVLVLLILIAAMIIIRRHLIHRKTDQSGKIKELEDKLNELEKKTQASE